MSRKFQIAAVLALLAAVAIMALVAVEYRHDRGSLQSMYTRLVRQRDIVDTARNAMSALQDAEISEQDYVLTGETVYSEAYANDIRVWQDELGTLELVAEHDKTASFVQDLSKSGTRVLDELAQLASLHAGGSRDAALDRIRKGSAFVYLEQARDLVAKIQQTDGTGADETNQSLIRATLRDQRRLAGAAAVLFCLTLAATLLLILMVRAARQTNQSVVFPEGKNLTVAK